MSTVALAFLIPLGVLVVFPLFWMAVVGLIGKMGWTPLASEYPADEWPARGFKVRWQSAAVGKASYSNALNAVATPEGLYLRPSLLFRVGHPPVFVPWGAFQDSAPGMFWGTRYPLENGPDLLLYGKLARAVSAGLEAYREASGNEVSMDQWDDGREASGANESGGSLWEAAANEHESGRSRREGRRRA